MCPFGGAIVCRVGLYYRKHGKTAVFPGSSSLPDPHLTEKPLFFPVLTLHNTAFRGVTVDMDFQNIIT
jgi:hypothetical protein